MMATPVPPEARAVMSELRSAVARKFRNSGLFLRRDASAVLQKRLFSAFPTADPEAVNRALDVVLAAVQDQPLDDTAVGPDVMAAVLRKLENSSAEDEMEGTIAELGKVHVISGFDVPHYYFHEDRKQFLPKPASHGRLHGEPDDKTSVFRDRFQLLRQRTLRNRLFVPSVAGVHQNHDPFKLTPVEALLGRPPVEGEEEEAAAMEDRIVILAMLSQLQEGKFFLEDLDGCVELQLRDSHYTSGLFTENCIVLAEGIYVDGVFRASTLGLPPPEPRHVTRSAFSGTNFFGGQSIAANALALKGVEESNEEAMLVVLSDVWLDQPAVMAKLRTLFEGYAQMDPTPTAFVLMGNFTSQPYGRDHHRILKESFDALAELIAQSGLEDSRFVFIPGPQDPAAGNILPRRPIPNLFTERLRRRVPNAEFTSNPARIRYCSQEIVLFREDIVNKMRRNCVLPPVEDEEGTEISTHLVKTLVDQAHLCPLPLHVRPVYWQHDQALRLYPLPDVLVLADRFDNYNLTYEGCTAFNPGSFMLSDFSFMVYWPARGAVKEDDTPLDPQLYERRVEYSQVP